MRFRHRTAIIISVLAVFALGAVGASMLFAAGPTPQYDTDANGMIEGAEAYGALRAYFDGAITQEQALDVLLHYWGRQPVSQPAPAAATFTPTPTVTNTPTPTFTPRPTVTPLSTPTSVPASTPTPQPTPTPIPTVTPTPEPTATPVPAPTPIPVLAGCRQRESGTFSLYSRTVVRQTSKHVDVQFVNPDPERHWEYGFGIREELGPYIVLHIDRYGEWVYTKDWTASADEIIDSGYLPDDVPWHTAAGERNQMTFFTRSANGRDANRVFSRYEDGYRVKINGVDMGEEFVQAFNSNLPQEYDRHRLDRRYLLDAYRPQQYENLCTVNSW